MPEYLVRAGPRLVECWSIARLPFEPVAWQRALRDELQSGVRQLQMEPTETLHAAYASVDQTLCDIENVLFYNVGPGAFANAMRWGVRFERRFSLEPNPALANAGHYYRYEPANSYETFKWWALGPTLRSWTAVNWPTASTATGWWDAFSRTVADLNGEEFTPSTFGVEINMHTPESRAVAVHEAIKPLLDGLIAACHRHVGTETNIVTQRVADSLGKDFHDVAERLVTDAGAVLGPRRLLWPWRNSVQWNPADDRCVATAVHVVLDPDGTEPVVDAGVFRASPRAD